MRGVIILGVLLIGWMIGGTWFWTCEVKQLCPGGAVEHARLADEQAERDQQQRAAEQAARQQEAARLALAEKHAKEQRAKAERLAREQAEQARLAAERQEAERLAAAQRNAEPGPSGALAATAPVVEWMPGAVSIGFVKGSGQITAESGLDDALKGIAANMQNTPGTLQVTAGFTADEAGAGAAENPGLQRAKAIAARLGQLGVDGNRIITSYTVLDESSTDVVAFEWLAADEAQTSAVRERFGEGVAVYFETGKSYVRLDADTRRQISGLIGLLNANPDMQLALIGHTDNTGDAVANLELGKVRAQSVADYLRAFGLRNPNVAVSSQGDQQPIADNGTEEGRALNRRVEMRLTSPNAFLNQPTTAAG